MMGVIGRMFRLYFDVARNAGFDPARIEAEAFPHGLDLARDYRWDLYSEITDAIGALIGSEAGVIEAFSAWPHAFPELVASLRHITDPLTVARLINVDIASPDLPGLRIWFRELGNDRFSYGHTTDAQLFRPSKWGPFVSVGLLQGQPCVIGLPRAHVEVLEATPHAARCLVTLPRARAVPAVGETSQVSEHPRGMLAMLTSDIQLRRTRREVLLHHAARLGHRLAVARTAADAARRVAQFLVEELRVRFAFVWLDSGPASQLLGACGDRDAESQLLPVVVARVRVGTLELPTTVDTAVLLPLLPLIAATLGRLGTTPPRWRLSPAESRVCSLVARGQTNAAIAVTLSMSVNTVAEHVGAILRKSRCTRRSELVVRWQRELGVVPA